jgi:outer membrane protein assembly factor BamE (lipoprotein component of BamABCDE complex)
MGPGAPFMTMKQLNHYLFAILATALLGCSSLLNGDPANPPAWDRIRLGMTREQVYASLGQPVSETQREADWKSPEVKAGWPSKTTHWRKLEVYFDESGRVNMTRDYAQQN